MSRSLFVTSIALAVLSSAITGLESRGQETAAQVEAKSQAARQQAARDRVNQKTLITKPSAGGAATRDRDEAATDPQPESLKRRAGEQVGDDARGRSQILGMYVQEGEGGRVRVVEVGAATPAFAAGIKRGDELASFSNFKANSYRKWIDGIRRLATEAKGGEMIPVVVLRNGEQVATEIRAPESHTGPIQLPIGPQVAQQPMPTGQQPDVVGVPLGGANVAIDSVGPFADFFNQNGTPAAERAMAELFRVNGSANNPNPNESEANPNTALPVGGGDQSPAALAGSPKLGNARIGLAGFRNDPNGMLVMVDVGGLQPGNYLVGIGDPSVAGQDSHAGGTVLPHVQVPAANQPGGTDNGAEAPAAATPEGPAPPAGGAEQPGNRQRTTRPAAPQSNVRPDERLIPRTVLAQVAANDVLSPARAQPNAKNGTSVPATGQERPATIPATGKVNPSSTLPTGQSAVNNALTEQMKQARSGQTGPGAAPITQPVGTLTVDQSGTGRLQQVVEGVQVQNVIGQALILVAQPAPTDATLPPNLDATVEGKVADQAQNATSQRLPNQTTSAAANGGDGKSVNGPVAAGIIRLLSDRGPGLNQAPAGSERSATNQPPKTESTGQPGAIR